MAAVKGVQMTLLDTKPVVYPSAAKFGGYIRQQHDSYTAAALSASTIAVARLPKGAVVHGYRINHAALGSGVTLALGLAAGTNPTVAAAPTKYMAATASATAAVKTDSLMPITGENYVLTTSHDVIITIAGAAATGLIECTIYYSTP